MAESSPAPKSVSAATFRAKVAEMKAWKPENSPSNRDRLELYALHKQAVSGDAPSSYNPADKSDASVAEKAKLNAWRNKRGLSQAEAMNLYVAECDRQMRIYGTMSATSAASSSTVSPGGTPTNTPAAAAGEETNSNVLLTPRGLAAIPLLCAAAAETRSAYVSRLNTTPRSNGWWARQEPLCADPGTALATPENTILFIASQSESLSLSIDPNFVLPPTVIQSFLWPLHNVLLAIWILLIFICTFIGSISIISKTILLGSKTTGVPLPSIFSEEIIPSSKAASSLCDSHQALSVRLVGLVLMPLVTICDVSSSTVENAGLLVGSAVYVLAGVVTWWYWICVVPCLAFWGVCLAIGLGWCFALIEVAGV